ncbi:hypothetical protein OIDMADRAFT_47997 [Oidiodendron maius Zn]|uniref:Uncharacterized protein n=1 Tax=Oidiodendron maius (strain Zn) TaxID=913774 RepID=A0A0C3D9Y1_OIDMZ|nr:hypothetical protein OIDMADRAFT_47997 [Oidiodendron maius Zn]
MDIPLDDVGRRSRSPSCKLASPRWSIARVRTLELHAEQLKERLERISPPRWKSREELYALAIAEPYDKAGVRMSPITPTPPSVLSPSPRPSLYQPSLFSRMASISRHTTQSPSPPTTRSMSLDDNTSLSSFESTASITKLATVRSPRQTTPFSQSTTPSSEHWRSCGEDGCVNVYQKPLRRRANLKSRSEGIAQRQSNYRIAKPSSHPMVTRSRRREGIR